MKVGKFLIPNELYDKDWQMLSGLFKHFKPFKVKYSELDRGYWFEGTSDQFKDVCIVDKPENLIPEYELIISSSGTNSNNMVHEFKFNRFDRIDKGPQAFYEQADCIISVTRDSVEGAYKIEIIKNRYNDR